MRVFILYLFLFALSGCATRVFPIQLVVPKGGNTAIGVTVKDERLDPQTYITGISIGSQKYIYLLAPNPSLDVTLSRLIESKLKSAANNPLNHEIEVSIKRLELTNNVGFARADELYCEIESEIDKAGDTDATHVRTHSKNTENMSPFITTSAKLILQQCLEQHASDIYKHYVP